MPPSKRNDIIKATVEVVSEGGLLGASTIKIAERAGVAEITIFRNFKTKEGLFNEIFDELLKEIRGYVVKGHDSSQPIKERFLALCRRFCSYMKAKPDNLNFFEQYLHSKHGWDKRPDMVHETDVEFNDYPLIAILDKGRKAGAIKNLPMPILVGLVVGTLFNFERQQQLKKVRHSPQVQEETLQACWDGVAN